MDIHYVVNYGAIEQANHQFNAALDRWRFPDSLGKPLVKDMRDVMSDCQFKLMGKLLNQPVQGYKANPDEIENILLDAHSKLLQTEQIQSLEETARPLAALQWIGKVIHACMSAGRAAGLHDPRIDQKKLAEKLGVTLPSSVAKST